MLLTFIGFCCLEWKMARLEPRWVGLVLPLNWFLVITFVMLLSAVEDLQLGDLGNFSWLGIIVPFITFNIPTMIYLTVYISSRSKMKKKRR